VRPAKQRRIRLFVPTVNPLRGSVGPRFRTCLADLFGAGGSDLSKIGPRALLVSGFATVLGVLAFMSAPALAAPEVPETLKPELPTITASSAVLRGVLSPHSLGELGATYEFVYRATETGECKGAGASSTTPGMVLGAEAEPVTEPVEGLSGQTVYAVCLIERNQAKIEEAVGPAVTFLTGPPETPEGEEAINITATSATLKAMLNPHHEGEPGRYRFRYRQSATECEGEGSQEIPDQGEPALTALGHRAEEVEVSLTGLLPNTTYTFCAWTRNEAFEGALGALITFTTPYAAPSVTGESVQSVSSDEATVSAEISPGGLATTYSVEYEAGKSTSEGSLPASKAPVNVRQRITGLQPGTQYHYRFIAHNALGDTQDESQTFATSAAAVSVAGGSSCANATLTGFDPALPDCRAYELVSGAGEVGEVYDPGGSNGREQDTTTARPFRAAANGDAVAYLADPGLAGGDGSSAKGRGNEYMATRLSSGWQAANITPPVDARESASDEREYKSFSPDLTVGTVVSEQPLLAAHPSPQGPEGCDIFYSALDKQTPVAYSALFTETLSPGFCGDFAGNNMPHDTSLLYAGESDDHATRVFDTAAALKAPAEEAFGYGANIYASRADGALALVSVLPNGEPTNRAVVGGPSELPQNEPDFERVVSANGEKIIWSVVGRGESVRENAAFPAALYVREDPFSPSARTFQIDQAEAGAPGPSGGGQFWAATPDAGEIFFTDCRKLTDDATAVEEGSCAHPDQEEEALVKTGADLYEYDFAASAGHRLTDVTVDHNPVDALGANVQGVIGVSQDGSYVYFVAGGSLGADANPRGEVPMTRNCEIATKGTKERNEEVEGHVPRPLGCNLFELHYSGTKWEDPRFIATLAGRDNAAAAGELNDPRKGRGEIVGDWMPNLGSRTAEVTPNGKAVVFSSTQDLTGYDTASIGGAGDQGGNEIFLYRPDAGSLTCVSCSPQNTPPVKSIQEGASDGAPPPGFSTYVPVSSSETFMHRWVNAEGTRVFFDSSQPLVSGDSNDTQDVYEWEAEGGPSCAVATSVYGGCVFLLSGGESPDFSFLVDADEHGENVFITHRGALGGAGPSDDKVHLYDVRVGGGFAASSLGCVGTGCQGVPPSAPLFATPASVTFNGVGNFSLAGSVKKVTKKTARCAKGKKLSRGKCVKVKSKKKKVKRANHGKGTNHGKGSK
jgi:hypothetical protein